MSLCLLLSALPVAISSLTNTIVTRSRHLAMPSSAFILRAGLALVSLTTTILQASAQVPTVTPTGTWKPKPTCSAGGDLSANGGTGGGAYTDKYGGLWDVRCGQALSGTVVEANVGTSGQGWYGCAKGCAKRPGCTAFHFVMNGVLPPAQWTDTTGSGSCHFRLGAGDYSSALSNYGATHLIRPNTLFPVSLYNMFDSVHSANKLRSVLFTTVSASLTPQVSPGKHSATRTLISSLALRSLHLSMHPICWVA